LPPFSSLSLPDALPISSLHIFKILRLSGHHVKLLWLMVRDSRYVYTGLFEDARCILNHFHAVLLLVVEHEDKCQVDDEEYQYIKDRKSTRLNSSHVSIS